MSNAQDRQLELVEFSGHTQAAMSATKIIGRTMDGQYVYGETIALGQGNTDRIPGTIAFDALQATDTDGDGLAIDPVCGDLAPHAAAASSRYFWSPVNGFSMQSWADDLIPDAGTEGGIVSSLVAPGIRPLCDAGAGGVSEPFQIVFESWEGFDNFPDLDGGDGEFGAAPDGLGFPASLTDADGDTFVDEFLGGIILTYANVDTDGDTVPDEQASSGAAGYSIFFATGLEALGVPLTSNLDLWDGGKPGTDGRGDGGVRILHTRGDGGDGLGPLGGLYPTTRSQQAFWGTYASQGGPGACAIADPGFGVGESDGILWGEGAELCGDGLGAWSAGAPSGNEDVDDIFDTSFDVLDSFGLIAAEFPNGVALALRITVDAAPPGRDCCDINDDGACTPADFSAWLAAFNGMLPTCDVNQDGTCSPADFSAWLAAFNASTGGNPNTCTF